MPDTYCVYHQYTVKVPNRGTDDSSPAFVREMENCIACGRCINVCNDVQKIKVYEMYYDKKTGDKYCRIKGGFDLKDTSCINCGQCVKVCPVGALTEKNGIVDALNAIDDPKKALSFKTVTVEMNSFDIFRHPLLIFNEHSSNADSPILFRIHENSGNTT